MEDITSLLDKLFSHHQTSLESINLTPSENSLSPLARLPFVLDAYSRYFLDDLRLFGDWSFPSGKDLGDIEQKIVIPLLKELTKANYVNVRPISGINCMTVALAALSKSGDIIYSVPVSSGGHPSTLNVAKRLGLTVKEIPFLDAHDIDYKKFEKYLIDDNPAMVYLDQATFLFPIDPRPIRNTIDQNKLDTIIHYDSSHTNGLIMGDIIENPLTSGAHCFGGSTHKTLPGPHKGFLATNDERLHLLVQENADHFVSHHHMASVVSLAITLLEFKQCGGTELMKNIMKNTKKFCDVLSDSHFKVITNKGAFSKTHQIWITYSDAEGTRAMSRKLLDAGIVLNCFGGLPGVNTPAYRLSLSEFTRCGADEGDAAELASCFIDLGNNPDNIRAVKQKVLKLKMKTDRPHYCYDINDLGRHEIKDYLQKIFY